ncbi:sterol carrier family protein [Streptacidiphilus sp. EB129]|uniref:maleylpyruvate isomerase family mycothiol-dependent enzyme n=1 Tax=Streptacidiphilus sp. EB129 TaxID=3156262 RepID=UPI003519713A
MSPAARTTRARTYDPLRTRAALAGQVEALRGAVHELCALPDAEELLAAPTRLGEWRVRDLIAHLAIVIDWVPKYLGDPVPDGEPLALTDWVGLTRTAAPTIAAGVREHAEAEFTGTPEELARTFDRPVDALLRTLAEDHAPLLRIAMRFGPMLLSDYLVTRVVETVVHADDLAAALPTRYPVPDAFPHDRQALAATTRLLADALAARAPGGSVELRIPPFAVVQCVAGPRHTRGTPPNVVETAPLPWIRLATGRRTWSEALDVAELTAGGERSDLSSLLPVMG